MQVNLSGRIRNTHLPDSKALLPLFEAVVNSIHAVEDAKINNGFIKVLIQRGHFQTGLIGEDGLAPIEGFIVLDNGIGFDEKNYNSFLTSDSSWKMSRGSKGIGRFLWLKAFNSISIISIYKDGDKYCKREFNFNTERGIYEHIHENCNTSNIECETSVKLMDFQLPYRTKCPQEASVMKKDDSGNYKLEKEIHEIVFPLRSTSEDVAFERQNLWIIDEKLTYHQYLASDQPLDTIQNLEVDSDERPDLLIFNNPIAFVEGEEQPYSSVVIVEFKRPMRGTYKDNENPITQVYDYIRKIKSGTFSDKEGRLVTLPEHTPFYAYIICDITVKIKGFAEDATYYPTPDLQGYFGYNPRLNTYVEILSFTKLINDAKKRNNVLFNKLNL